jgi:hypothetical protein
MPQSQRPSPPRNVILMRGLGGPGIVLSMPNVHLVSRALALISTQAGRAGGHACRVLIGGRLPSGPGRRYTRQSCLA